MMRDLIEQVFVPEFADETLSRLDDAATVEVLRTLCPTLPEAKRGFWDGTGTALAVRPRGGVRGASATGDTAVLLLEGPRGPDTLEGAGATVIADEDGGVK